MFIRSFMTSSNSDAMLIDFSCSSLAIFFFFSFSAAIYSGVFLAFFIFCFNFFEIFDFIFFFRSAPVLPVSSASVGASEGATSLSVMTSN